MNKKGSLLDWVIPVSVVFVIGLIVLAVFYLKGRGISEALNMTLNSSGLVDAWNRMNKSNLTAPFGGEIHGGTFNFSESPWSQEVNT